MGDLMEREPGITSVETLMEFARRSSAGRNLRLKRQEAVDFMRKQGRYQVYKRVPQEWEGTISKPTGTDVRAYFEQQGWGSSAGP